MDEHQLALNKAKIQLMSRKDTVFFTTVLFSLIHKWDETIPTAGTDGKTIYFSPAFFMSLDAEERLFLLLHEALHVAFLHMSRLKDRDHQRWNAAADYVINDILIERGFKMPKNGLHDLQYRGMTAEQVYALLPVSDPIDVPMMDLMPPPEDIPDLQEQVQDILIRASIQSKNQGDAIGTIPGEIQIFLEGLLAPKLPWYRILQKYIQSIAKFDYTFRKPNRRFLPKYIMPGMFSESLIDVTIAVDTSGSVSDTEFGQFISETASIFKMLNPGKITLIQFDTKIKDVSVLRSVQDLRNVDFVGRGGTKIAPVMKWAEEKKPQLLLIFTDGDFTPAPKYTEPKSSVIWIIHNNPEFKANFGKTIHYSIET